MLTLCPLEIFHGFCRLQIFLKIDFFKNFLRCQSVRIKIRLDILSDLIWVQTVCKTYQQTTRDIELIQSHQKKNFYFKLSEVKIKGSCIT